MTTTNKVLIADDDTNILASFRRRLGRRFEITTVLGGEQGLEFIDNEGPYAVVISDQRMPGMDGIDFLHRVRERAPDTVRMMLTGNTDLSTAVKAVNQGNIFRFFTKPCSPDDLADAIEAGLRQYNLVTAEKELLEATLAGSVKVLVDILTLVHHEATERAPLVREWAGQAARWLSVEDAWELDLAAMLAPIGLITIPPDILDKMFNGGSLKKVEREIVDRAPEVARNLISNIPRMEGVARIIYYQNKGYDGSGFPSDWVAGPDIPEGARILRILHDLATVSDVPDRAAFDAIAENAAHYDPGILKVIRTGFLGKNGKAGPVAAEKVLKVSADALWPGARLVSNIEAEDGTLLLAAGRRISQAQIELLHNMRRTRRIKEPIHVAEPERPGSKRK